MNSIEKQLGGWSFEPELYHFLRENLLDGKTILELGSGRGTGVLSNHYKMISIEHDDRFINRYNSTYIHAPMQYHWYDIRVVERNVVPLWGEYDCILVDGPPGHISRYRIGFLENITMFDVSKLIVVDDTNRNGERVLFEGIFDYCNFDFATEQPKQIERKFEHFKTFSVIFPE